MKIKHFFDKAKTATFTYVVSDPKNQCMRHHRFALDYDMNAGKTTTMSADKVIAMWGAKIKRGMGGRKPTCTCRSFDRLHYLKENSVVRSVSASISRKCQFWVPLFNTAHDTPPDGRH